MVEYQFMRVIGVYNWLTCTNGVTMGIEPIARPDIIKRSEGELIQGEKVYTENAVYHRHYEGTLRLYPSKEFYYAPNTGVYSSLPPRLIFRRANGELRDAGMCRIPHDGNIHIWKHPGGYYIGGVWNGFLLRMINSTLYQEYRFISNYLTCFGTSYSTGYQCNEKQAIDLLTGPSRFGYSSDEPASWGSALPTGLNVVGDDPMSVMPYVLLDRPVKDRYPSLPDSLGLWSDLTKRAIDSLDTIDINSISFLKELGEWRRLLPPIPKTLKDLKKPKSWASFYLWLRYGLRLTVQDSKEIIQRLPDIKRTYEETKSSKKTRLRASDTIVVRWNDETWSCRLGIRIVLDTYPEFCRQFGKFADDLNSLDLYPNLANLWDLIPFSFVLDWFIPVQNWLEKVDSELRALNFQIYCITQSTKWSRSIPPPYVPGYVTSDSLSEVHYIRKVGLDLPHPVFTWNKQDNSPDTNYTIWKRMADGIALLLQGRR
ncbi:maturation protein [ssRNA phage SRR6960799_2]|uniref:Maturation protein n=1 Tax=ssRNA phage SRR6960799_2 TaxID=2786576 RepID=A0A8S5L4C5_9VIRU|nr:maturation protein [ssRNA phage SRR6960799_2]DAD52268.1 TPA_asm: maturation protein [ssRNA phage SRR6960799_2]